MSERTHRSQHIFSFFSSQAMMSCTGRQAKHPVNAGRCGHLRRLTVLMAWMAASYAMNLCAETSRCFVLDFFSTRFSTRKNMIF